MDMIGDSTDLLWETTQPTDRSSQLLLQARPPGGVDHRHAVFGAEDDVVVEA
jgi:hypothetical protein